MFGLQYFMQRGTAESVSFYARSNTVNHVNGRRQDRKRRSLEPRLRPAQEGVCVPESDRRGYEAGRSGRDPVSSG